ncbi:NAD(P)/FAD-dependent oxidoreductase [Nitriliruptor alkaliphilus]|uniref:NAD(P)/FAD-dependent oxidoreductase n=1 Tax=Nitriliruptor alkaliphilus TaxID=427918 RepID=UPI0006980CB5|nr:NAD(P)/FAD-dependent oxidoreductase [Nitriliruptor alkaliphilus]
MSAQPTSQHDTPSPAAGARRDRHRVVVVGGGFGGLNVVRELGRSAVAGDLDVVLVDKRNHHTFQPLLYQVATAGLQPHDIGMSLRSIRGVRRTGPDGRPTTDVRLGEVVDVDDHGVVLADGARLPYDHLVVAAGGITNDLGIPGVAEHAFGLKSLPEAAQLRNHLLRRFEAASADPAHLSDGTLTFVIAGGGPTGVELAGALAELVDQVLTEDHPTLDIAHVRIVLLELTDRLLPGFSDRSHRVALQRLERRGVEVRLGTGAEEVTADQVTLSNGEVLPARTLVWATGIAGVPLGAKLGVEPGRAGRIPVDARMRAVDADGRPARDGRLLVIGDLAGAVAGGDALPQVAPVAIQQGRYVADLIVREVAGDEPPPPFRYRDKGKMATIGRTDAVVELPFKLRFSGFPAWIAWLVLHLLWLVGFRNRISVLVTWAWNYLTYDHSARLLIDQREAEEADTSKGRIRRSWADRSEDAPPPEGNAGST